MKHNTVGIVCEYNPFHYGHQYHIAQAKKLTGASRAVCVMSGSFVQRGEPAICDKWQRAKSAIDGGADLVIELPAYYALQSADNFAFGAVSLLDGTGIVDSICFGAETDDISLLKKASMLRETPVWQSKLAGCLSAGAGYPSACETALRSVMPDAPDNLFLPNNILAMGYIYALSQLNSAIEPFCLKRNNDYHSDQSSDGFKSATAIRDMIQSGKDYSSWAPLLPESASICSLSNADSFILGFFRRATPFDLADVKGYEDGLANLVINSAKKACTSEELFEMCTSKRYTLHRIKRFCACAILGIRGNHTPDYLRILAANSKGTAMIKEIKEASRLVPVVKAADYSGSAMFDMDVAATDFASLCQGVVSERYAGKDYTKSPVIVG